MTATDRGQAAMPIVAGNGRGGHASAVEMRTARRMVRQTASLVAIHGPVREQPGPYWAADFERRIIFWRLTEPTPPHRIISHNQMLFLITHEAYHLNLTGRWKTPDDFVKDRFHRFVNGVEDIRIERHAERDFPGFAPLRRIYNRRALENHRRDAAGYALADQVWMNWMCMEAGVTAIGHPVAIDFAKKTWPSLTMIANARSTAAMAEMLEPIYRLLIKPADENALDPDKEQPGANGASGPGDVILMEPSGLDTSQGCGSPADPTERSIGDDLDSGIGDKTPTQQLVDMSQDAKTEKAKQSLLDKATKEASAQGRSNKDATQYGQGAGRSGHRDSSDSSAWSATVDRMRAPINTLSRRLETTLRFNASDEWESGLRRGQLDVSQAYRSMTGTMDIFRDRHAVGRVDYAFGWLFDVSDSMTVRSRQMLDAAVLVLESMDRAGLNSFALCWDDKPYVLKPIGKAMAPYRGDIAGPISHCPGGTYEAPALIIAEEQFLRVPRRIPKILTTITDGHTVQKHESQAMIDVLMSMGVHPMVIAINCNVPDHYPTGIKIADASELVDLFPKLVNSVVRKGGQ